MNKRLIPAIAALLVIPALAWGQGDNTNGASEVTAHQILSGYEKGAAQPMHKVVRSNDALSDLLQQVYSGQAAPQPPHIDFSKQVLVFYGLGSAMHRGDRVYVRSGSLDKGVLHVNVEIAKPGESCLQTHSLTAPFALAALPFPAYDVKRAEYSISHKSYPCR